MNFKEGSPFHKRIKILGKATGSGTEVLTQSTFVDRLLRLISNDPMGDRDRIKRKKALDRAREREPIRVFRNGFIEEKDAEIAKIVWNYFLGVSTRWPGAWTNLERGRILARTTGFAALMRLLPDVIVDIGDRKEIPKVGDFVKYFKRSSLTDGDFTSDNFKPGSSGEGDLVRALKEEVISSP